MTRTKSKASVDYTLPTRVTLGDATREWKAAARAFKAAVKGDESRTVANIRATRDALKAGLIVGGSVQGKSLPEGAISRSAFAAEFCSPLTRPDGKAASGSQVTTPLITGWERAAHCWDLGITPDHPLWTIVVVRKACRRNAEPFKVGDRIMAAKSVKAVETALQADGWDLATGVRSTGPRKSATENKGKDDDSKESANVKPRNAFKAAQEAANTLRVALEALPVTSGKAEQYKAIREHVRSTMAGQDRARGILAAPAVAQVVTPATVAAVKASA